MIANNLLSRFARMASWPIEPRDAHFFKGLEFVEVQRSPLSLGLSLRLSLGLYLGLSLGL